MHNRLNTTFTVLFGAVKVEATVKVEVLEGPIASYRESPYTYFIKLGSSDDKN